MELDRQLKANGMLCYDSPYQNAKTKRRMRWMRRYKKEKEEKEQARMSGMMIMNIIFKTDVVVKESIRNNLSFMLFWVTLTWAWHIIEFTTMMSTPE